MPLMDGLRQLAESGTRRPRRVQVWRALSIVAVTASAFEHERTAFLEMDSTPCC